MSNKVTAYKNGKKIQFTQTAWNLLSEKDRENFQLKQEPPAGIKNIINNPGELEALQKMKQAEKKEEVKDPGNKSNDELYTELIQSFKEFNEAENYEEAYKAIVAANELKPSPYTRTKIKQTEEILNKAV